MKTTHRCRSDPEVLFDWITDQLFLERRRDDQAFLHVIREADGRQTVGEQGHEANDNLHKCDPIREIGPVLWHLFDDLVVFVLLAGVDQVIEESATKADTGLAIARALEGVPAAVFVLGVRIRRCSFHRSRA